MPLLSAESRKQRGHHLSGVAAERIIAAADAPVVQKSAFYYRVGLNYVVGGKVGAEDSLVLSLYGYLAEELVVLAVGVQKAPVGAGYQLGGEQPSQKVQGDRVLNHVEELVV